ncbi:hypothetical protein EJB05_37331, partial [Eragrostis curvula]
MHQGFVVTRVSYYLQAWCMEMKGPVFLAAWAPLCFILTMFVSYFFLGETVHLGSSVGGILLCGGLFSVLCGKSKEGLRHLTRCCALFFLSTAMPVFQQPWQLKILNWSPKRQNIVS